MQVVTFDSDHHVLEFAPEHWPPGVVLRLHLGRPADGSLWAWWMTDEGDLLLVQEVGEA